MYLTETQCTLLQLDGLGCKLMGLIAWLNFNFFVEAWWTRIHLDEGKNKILITLTIHEQSYEEVSDNKKSTGANRIMVIVSADYAKENRFNLEHWRSLYKSKFEKPKKTLAILIRSGYLWNVNVHLWYTD